MLEPNEKYTGDKKLANGKVLVQVYKDEASLKSAVESGEVQVAYQSLHRPCSRTSRPTAPTRGSRS